MASATTAEDIADETWIHIFQFLSPEEGYVGRASLVCRRWSVLLDDTYLWKDWHDRLLGGCPLPPLHSTQWKESFVSGFVDLKRIKDGKHLPRTEWREYNLSPMQRNLFLLFRAIKGGHTVIIDKLLKDNPNLANAAEDWSSPIPSVYPLHYAVKAGRYEVMKMLVEQYNASLTQSPVVAIACKQLAHQDRLRELKYLLEKGADPDRILRHMTPLQYCAAAGSIEGTQLLLSQGANIQHRNRVIIIGGPSTASLSILGIAAKHGHTELVKYLLDHHTQKGETPSDQLLTFADVSMAFQASVASKKEEVILLLLEAIRRTSTETLIGAEIRKALHSLLTLFPCPENILERTRLLLSELKKENLPVGAENSPSQRVLQQCLTSPAVKAGNLPLLRMLVEAGLDVNSPIREPGWTALHEAVRLKLPRFCRVLLCCGADPSRKVKRFGTPKYYAGQLGLSEFVDMMVDIPKGLKKKRERQMKKESSNSTDERGKGSKVA